MKLGNLIKITSGYPFPSSELVSNNNGTPVIKIKELKSKTVVFSNDTNFYCGDKALEEYCVTQGDILVAMTGNPPTKPNLDAMVGRCSRYPYSFTSLLNQRICKVESKSPLLLTKYLYYWLSRDGMTEFLAQSSKGSANQANISNRDILSLEIDLVSVAQQSHIVDILGSIDDSIENNEKIIEVLEEKMLLEYDRLITSTALAESEMQEIFDISIGKTPPRKESHWFTEKSEDVKWLSISDMGKAKVFAFDSSEKITAEGIEKYNVKIAPENTVLLSFKLTIGKVAITGCEMATNEAIAHFVSDDENIVEYLYCYLKRYNFDMLGNTSSIATAVNSKTIKAMKFYYPDKETLADFHSTTEPLIKKIKHLLITNAKLNKLKQLYLKKFFG